MSSHYKWTQDRLGIIVNGWRDGKPVSVIADVIGATPTAIIAKAASMGLPRHPLAGPNHQKSPAAQAIRADQKTLALIKMEPKERAKYIRMPTLGFLEHRFGWETEGAGR